jgi:hypothetical protein
MSATSLQSTWRFAIAAFLLAASASLAEAQNSSTFTLTPTNSVGNPTGANFAAGFWVVTSLAYNAVCGSNRPKCVIKINASGTLTKPPGAITQVEYSVDGGAFAVVPSSATALGASFTGTKSGTIVIRYPLGWAGSPFTPASATPYSQLVQFNIQQGQP